MKSHFPPDSFEVTPERLKWAMDTFGITKAEVMRQTDEWHDWEYKRAYTDWNRAWKRWFRQADKFDLLRREHQPRKPEEITSEQIEADRLKGEQQLQKYMNVTSIKR